MTYDEAYMNDTLVKFVNTTPVNHNIQTTIHHWQLRDLLYCPYSENIVYLVNGTCIIRYNTQNKIKKVVKELEFDPISMSVKDGYLVAGGQRNQLYFRNLKTGDEKTISVGGTINNSLLISKYGENGHRLYVSNNDGSIKIFTLPHLINCNNITLNSAVNNCSISPDGKHLVAVGDCKNAWLLDVRNNCKNIATFKGCLNAAFSCSWNYTSDKFAIACQDGSVSIWDVKYLDTPLVTIKSRQKSNDNGAMRNVKFSPSGTADLLTFSEHESYVHLVCARTFRHRQIINIVELSNYSQNIAGLAFSPQSTKLYVAMENSLKEFDIDLTRRRQFPSGNVL